MALWNAALTGRAAYAQPLVAESSSYILHVGEKTDLTVDLAVDLLYTRRTDLTLWPASVGYVRICSIVAVDCVLAE